MDQQRDQQSSVEDLTVTSEQAVDVKGGAVVDYFLKLEGVDGDVAGPIKAGYNLKQNQKI